MKKTLLAILAVMAVFPAIGKVKAKPVVSVLGDSYSTFQDYIPPGNDNWYFTNPADKRSDVRDVRKTWWWQVIEEGGYILGVNESYSGSTISYTGYRHEDFRERSFITRLKRIVPSDVLLIFGGTNDSWCGAPMGDYVYDVPTVGHLYEFRPALAKLLTEARNRFPGTRIVFMLNTELKPEVNESVETICAKCGVELLKLKDISKQNAHPDIKGMESIKKQVLEFLAK